MRGKPWVAALFLATSALFAVGCAPAMRSAHHAEEARGNDALSDPAVVAAASRVRVIPGKLYCASELLGLVDVHEHVDSQAAALELSRNHANA